MVADQFDVGHTLDMRSAWIQQAFELGIDGRTLRELLPGPPIAPHIFQAMMWAHFLGKFPRMVKAGHPFFVGRPTFHRGVHVSMSSAFALGLAAGAPRSPRSSYSTKDIQTEE